MKNRTYDFFKSLALIWLPALGTLYFTVGGIWHLPYTEQVIGTITAVDTFLGVVLRIASGQYSKNPKTDGDIIVNTKDPDKDVFTLDLSKMPELKDKQLITLRVTDAAVTPPSS